MKLKISFWNYLKQCFLEEIPALSKTVESKSLAKKSSGIYSLDPTLNDKGLLCAGGRLKRAPLNEHCIHPVLLPKEGYITQLKIQWCHDETQHSGRGITLSKLRSRGYWIVNGNSAVRRLISKCVICKKLRGNMSTEDEWSSSSTINSKTTIHLRWLRSIWTIYCKRR